METTIFMNGQSQAIRIPKDYRLKGNVCEISKRGDELIIREKRSVSWSQFLETYPGAPEFDIERNHTSPRKIEL
jgi:antitoxin VapB